MKFLKTIAVQLFTGVNAGTILLLWACCLVTYLSPAAFPRLTLLSLAFPVFLLADVLFVFFWLVFKVRRVWLPLAGLAACYPFVRAYCPLNLPVLAAAAPADSTDLLRVVTYNTCSFGGTAARDEQGNNPAANFIYFCGADIICLQESGGGGASIATVKENMQAEGYECYQHKGLAIFSRLPILDSDTIVFPTRSNGALMVHLLYGADTLLLINSHLESNHLTEVVKDGYREAIERSALGAYERGRRDTLRKELSPVVNLLSEAAPLRAAQTDSVQHHVEAWLPRPVILCGDFNDTPVSRPLRLLTRHLKSAFTQSGNGVGFTFHDRGFPVRIDHILFSGDYWQSRCTRVDKSVSVSDHFPVHAELVRKRPKTP